LDPLELLHSVVVVETDRFTKKLQVTPNFSQSIKNPLYYWEKLMSDKTLGKSLYRGDNPHFMI